ncbi:S-adenosyl-L-methionine-dependent methyltransferase [Elsinoe ampelina]|uniref:DNA (cytosine-5-)-methyltransferase n=1 Tax=Elsinoe ampelina TaxID=302913 RepID=A0A6A6GCR6_9PEZI|nr:S-adenosyl-L-methionine-dependent methyltransferase [Elsinoe ampelina]
MPPVRHRRRRSPEAQRINDDDDQDSPVVIEIADDSDVDIVEEERNVHNSRVNRHRSIPSLTTSPSQSPFWISIDQYPEYQIRIGTVLKLHRLGDYVQIQQMFTDSAHDDKLIIRGRRFRKMSSMPGGLEREPNEVTMMQEVYTDSATDAKGFVLETFEAEDVLPISKRLVRLTNYLRPVQAQQGRLIEHIPEMQRVSQARDHRFLICRSKYCAVYNGPSTANPRKVEEIWTNLTDKEADSNHSFDDMLIRQKVKELLRTSERGDSQYTACDGFCGAGFASAGAEAASLKVVWSFDNDPKAMHSYRRNHRNVKTLLMDFFNVVRQYGDRIKVDVLMLSFPCQYFSYCHTVPGRNDDANEVAMLGLGDILAKFKPRLVVIEQTGGLDRVRFRQHLMAVIAGFRNNDYSVRKGVTNFAGLGQSSRRRRLMFFGAAAGERLPPFPKQIYNIDFVNPRPDLFPAVSIKDVLARVVGNHPEHRFERADISPAVAPIDPRTTQLGTFTCTRNRRFRHNIHWFGKRFWTIHELLLLQGAPARYRLKGNLTTKLKQIGNAFPSIAAEQFYRECVKSLQATDREDAMRLRGRREETVASVQIQPPPAGSSPDRPIAIR